MQANSPSIASVARDTHRDELCYIFSLIVFPTLHVLPLLSPPCWAPPSLCSSLTTSVHLFLHVSQFCFLCTACGGGWSFLERVLFAERNSEASLPNRKKRNKEETEHAFASLLPPSPPPRPPLSCPSFLASFVCVCGSFSPATMSTKHDIVKTPLPFPTLPIAVTPKSERSWIQNNWWVVFVVETVVIFVAFCGLLVYYLCFVRTPGKWITEDKVDSDGLSHHGSTVGDSEFGGSQRSLSNHSSSRRSFDEESAAGTVESRAGRRRGRLALKRR
jgi:hypothetical protein